MDQKKYPVWTLTFFGASSSNFFNKGLPNKFLMFLSSVLIPLSNDTTFVEKNDVALNWTFTGLWPIQNTHCHQWGLMYLKYGVSTETRLATFCRYNTNPETD